MERDTFVGSTRIRVFGAFEGVRYVGYGSLTKGYRVGRWGWRIHVLLFVMGWGIRACSLFKISDFYFETGIILLFNDILDVMPLPSRSCLPLSSHISDFPRELLHTLISWSLQPFGALTGFPDMSMRIKLVGLYIKGSSLIWSSNRFSILKSLSPTAHRGIRKKIKILVGTVGLRLTLKISRKQLGFSLSGRR